ncbi:T9SS type B sorting domain-containing protein [Pedobacter sp. HMF7647]|uniref:T9SS type B sorting domain-containing protein n=1 Tax=Hufsiella arboris TaxID=2695275 RepID=A0A7K1YCY6_9SPHI|nr:gliding motility-associated C-terminal domain-containing protein [Hufsiella arboris]MXV52443.1 T9SS type B sorting domain-containing protein [Hufsiella arboris]
MKIKLTLLIFLLVILNSGLPLTTSIAKPLGDPAPSKPIVTIVEPDCTTATGTITVTNPLTGAGLYFSINGSSYTNTTGIFKNLVPGTYSVTYKDASGKISQASKVCIHKQPAKPSKPVASVTQPTCKTATGTVKVTAPAPAAGLTYSIDGITYANTSGVFTGLVSGNYTITVKNAAGCISAETKVCVHPQPSTPVKPTITVVETNCTTATGSIRITSPVPASGQTYSINGSTYLNVGGVFKNLVPGNYSVTYKTASGCISAPAIVSIHPQPQTPAKPTVQLTQPDCITATGIIRITSPAPATGQTYSINGTTYQNIGGVFKNLKPGNYLVSVKGPDGCISDVTKVCIHAQPAKPSKPVATVKQPDCNRATGVIKVSLPAATNGTTYSLDGVSYSNTTGVFNDVSSGVYSVTARNAAGCTSDTTKICVHKQPQAPDAPVVAVTQPDCTTSTGIIRINSPAPATGQTYSINGTTYQNVGGVFKNLAAGKYMVTVKSAAGCISDATEVTILKQTLPQKPVLALTQPNCSTTTGAIKITSPIPADGQTYSVDGLTYDNTSGVFENLVPGMYKVTVKNSSGCISTVTEACLHKQEIPSSPVLAVTQPDCSLATGSIRISSPAPAAGQTYSINGSIYLNVSGVFKNLLPGTYPVTVKNAAGCISAAVEVVINQQPSTPTAPVLVVAQPTYQIATGTITVIAPAPEAGITYSIDGSDFSNTSGVFTGLQPGNYMVSIKTAAGCISTAENVTISTQPVPPAPPVNNKPVIAPATFTIVEKLPVGTYVGTPEASDPDAGTTFSSWTLVNGNDNNAFAINPATGIITVANSEVLDFESRQVFHLGVTVSDGTNVSELQVVTVKLINVNEPPVDIALSNSQIYENNANGAVIGKFSSVDYDSSSGFVYSLVPGPGSGGNASFDIDNSGNLLAAASFDYESQNSYSIRVRSTDNSGEYFEKLFNINVLDVNEAPQIAAISDQAICYDASEKSLSISGLSAGPEAGQQIELAASADNAAMFDKLSVIKVNGTSGELVYKLKSGATGTAWITLSVTDNGGVDHGGINTAFSKFKITVTAPPVAKISSEKSLSISKGDDIILKAEGGSTYKWSAANGIIGGTDAAELKVRPQETTTYWVTVSNVSGCSSIAQITVIVKEDYALIPNNVITPNNDGNNDTWVVKNIDYYKDNKVDVFDRAGRLVYSASGYNNSWDGSFDGKPLTQGTYYYIITFKNVGALKGFITVIR